VAGKRQREENLRYSGRRQPPHQSDRGASEMDEEEQGKFALRHIVVKYKTIILPLVLQLTN